LCDVLRVWTSYHQEPCVRGCVVLLSRPLRPVRAGVSLPGVCALSTCEQWQCCVGFYTHSCTTIKAAGLLRSCVVVTCKAVLQGAAAASQPLPNSGCGPSMSACPLKEAVFRRSSIHTQDCIVVVAAVPGDCWHGAGACWRGHCSSDGL